MKKIILLSLLFQFTYSFAQWHDINGPFNGNQNNNVVSLATDGVNTFALTDSIGVYYTSDNGNHWQSFNNNLNYHSNSFPGHLKSIAINGTDIYLASDNGILKSTISGNGNWSYVNNSLNVTSFAFNGSQIYAATYQGVYTSTNNGVSWASINSGLGNLSVTSITYDSGNLYAGTYGGVYKSTNNGASWSLANSGISSSGNYISSICANGNTILVGTASASSQTGGSGVYISTNGGLGWSQVTGISTLHTSSIFKTTNSIYVTYSALGYYVTHDNGVTWTQVNNSIQGIGCALGTQVIIGEAIGTGKIVLSNDDGVTWNNISFNISTTEVKSIAFIGTNLSISSGSGCFTSSNDGSEWHQSGGGGIGNSTSIVSMGKKLFAAGDGSGDVNMSPDTGKTWSTVNTGLGGCAIYSLAVKDTTIYTGTLCGIYKSSNYGANWVQISTIAYTHGFLFKGSDIYIIVGNPVIRYTDQIYKSNDNGLTWNLLSFGIADNHITSIIGNGNDIFIGTYGYDVNNQPVGKGVYQSSDDGATWNLANNGITVVPTTALLSDGGNLYAATTNYNESISYIFSSADNGVSWHPFDSLINKSSRFDLLSSNGVNIYCGTKQHGLWEHTSQLTGISYFSEHKESIKAFPNPSNGNITFEFDNFNLFKSGSITVINILCQLILSSNITQEKPSISLEKGTYFAKILNSDGKILEVKKLIVE